MAAKKTEEKNTAKTNKPKPKRKLSVNQVVALKDRKSDVYTAEGKQLTVKEAKFVDSYVASGNIRQSVIDAGYKYSKDDGDFAGQIGNVLLGKNYIKREIDKRLHDISESKIASREEIMQFFSDMMRGKILDQFDMPTTNADKIKAAQELAKRSIDIEDRIKEKTQATIPEIKISLDWGGAHGKKE